MTELHLTEQESARIALNRVRSYMRPLPEEAGTDLSGRMFTICKGIRMENRKSVARGIAALERIPTVLKVVVMSGRIYMASAMKGEICRATATEAFDETCVKVQVCMARWKGRGPITEGIGHFYLSEHFLRRKVQRCFDHSLATNEAMDASVSDTALSLMAPLVARSLGHGLPKNVLTMLYPFDAKNGVPCVIVAHFTRNQAGDDDVYCSTVLEWGWLTEEEVAYADACHAMDFGEMTRLVPHRCSLKSMKPGDTKKSKFLLDQWVQEREEARQK